MISIEDLHEDCLRKIFKLCSLEDHIALAESCCQFKMLVQEMLQRDLTLLRIQRPLYDFYEYFLLETRNSKLRIPSKHLKFVLELIHRFVKNVAIENYQESIWKLINKFEFVETDKLYLSYIREAPIGEICFPNIRKLEVSEESIVNFKPQWSKVEELVLRARSMTDEQSIDLFQHMKLKRLQIFHWNHTLPTSAFSYLSEVEEFAAYSNLMLKFSDAFESMRKLKLLSIYFYRDEMRLGIKLLTILQMRIVEMFVDVGFIDTTEIIPQLSQLTKLRKITLTSRSFDDIWRVPYDLPMFKAVCMQRCFSFLRETVTAKKLTATLVKYQNLEFIQFEDWRSNAKRIYLDVLEIAKLRRIPVTINLFFSRIGEEKFEILLSAPTDLIKVTYNAVVMGDYNCEQIFLD